MMETKKSPTGAAGKDPFEQLLGYHIRRLSVLVMSDLSESLAPHKLNPADASILLTIGASPGVTQSEVGRALGILRANMAPLVAALESRGLVERKPVDGRSQALTLTAPGQTLARQIKTITKTHEERLFGRLSAAERRNLVALLKSLWQRTPSDE